MSRYMRPIMISATAMFFGLGLVGSVTAAPVYCDEEDSSKNYMSIDDTQVDLCLAAGFEAGAGFGSNNDPFIGSSSDDGYQYLGKDEDENSTSSATDNDFNVNYTQSGDWRFDSEFWDQYDDGALGFKFGTGQQADNWFVYSLQSDVSSGDWEFFKTSSSNGGDGLSHVALLGKSPVAVPAPGTLALAAFGLVAMMFGGVRRRHNRSCEDA
ncbi:putative secreted protein with PEP-CTERM sorting signal [Spiribacter vilamensis]|uniref:Putative secreted protein with PEP-CTERM sorting signal n=2 Tax=Spiribacter vilamensis TaxID=531306 RepID=A0A4Q8D307_9GAMM|nr:putative secreted protein with PEP-CTERM sorting signal [Spiribacter vilamensis]